MAMNLYNQANIYYSLGMHEIARNWFNKLLKIEKQFPDNLIPQQQSLRYFFLIKFEISQNQLEEAYKHLNRLRDIQDLGNEISVKSDLIDLRYHMSRALIMISSNRLIDKE